MSDPERDVLFLSASIPPPLNEGDNPAYLMWGGRLGRHKKYLLNEVLHLNAEGDYLHLVHLKSHSFKSKTGTLADKKPQNKTTKPAFSRSPPARSEQQQRGRRKLRARRDWADIFPMPELLADSSRNLKPPCVPRGLSGESRSRSLRRTITAIPNTAARMRSPHPFPDGAGKPPGCQPACPAASTSWCWLTLLPCYLYREKGRERKPGNRSHDDSKRKELPRTSHLSDAGDSSCETQTTTDLRVHGEDQEPGHPEPCRHAPQLTNTQRRRRGES